MTLTEAINPISVSSEIERKTENDGQLCPDKVFLQLHHREMWPDHKKSLPCAPALHDIPDAPADTNEFLTGRRWMRWSTIPHLHATDLSLDSRRDVSDDDPPPAYPLSRHRGRS